MDIPKHKFEIAKTMMIFAVLVLPVLLVSSASMAQAADKDPELVKAAREGDLKEVIRLLDQGAEVNAGGEYGTASLMWAAERGESELVKALLDKGAETNAKDNNGKTALMWASKWSDVETVKLLKAHGAK
jgi:ankyrin repeat protein